MKIKPLLDMGLKDKAYFYGDELITINIKKQKKIHNHLLLYDGKYWYLVKEPHTPFEEVIAKDEKFDNLIPKGVIKTL